MFGLDLNICPALVLEPVDEPEHGALRGDAGRLGLRRVLSLLLPMLKHRAHRHILLA